MTLADEMKVEIPCPNCQTKISQSLRDLQNSPKLTCPSCRAQIQMQTEGGDAPVEALDDLERALRDFGKR